MQVVTLDIPELGNRCHLVHDGTAALVVDPPRDPARVEGAAEEAGVEIAAVADTHVHNDYVSGALALARRHGADYLLSADEAVRFERTGVRDGDVLPVGSLEVRVLDTPGHTRHHQSFLVGDGRSPEALFSGGSMLHGAVGRTDLVAPGLTRLLAGQQWASVRRLGALDDATRLHPTHGFGSFCAGSSPTAEGAGTATVGEQRAANPALVADRERFVEDLLAGLGPVPAYYAHMGELNRAGTGRRPARPGHTLSADEVAAAVRAGAWVVDLRPRSDFARNHRPGTVSVEYSHQFATYVGWLAPWGGDLVVLADHLPDLAPALRDLAGIGIEGVGTHVLTSDATGGESYRRTDWAGFRDHPGHRVVVDVRQRDEFEAGHLEGAVHLPVHELPDRVHELPAGDLWVHCRSGYRAGIAASLLHRAGRTVVHVDDSWERVAALSLPVSSSLAA